MVDSINAGATSASKISTSEWKTMSAKDILEQEELGEEVPAAIVTWANEITNLEKVPDTTTYEAVNGTTDIEALEMLLNPSAVETSDLGDEDSSEFTDEAIAGAMTTFADTEDQPMGLTTGIAAEDGEVIDPTLAEVPEVGEEGAEPPKGPQGAEGAMVPPPPPKEEADEEGILADDPGEITLADEGITADTEEILKRKERKGIKEEN
ncbi:MAG: hypothetical protein R3Y28_03320 [Candidatus Gastranaerophilales bacterium]